MTLRIRIEDCFPVKATIEFNDELGNYVGTILSHANKSGCIVRKRESIVNSFIVFVEYSKITKVITNV